MEDPYLKTDRLFTHHTKRAVVASTLRENRLLQEQQLHLEAERRSLVGEYRHQIQRVKRRAEQLRKVKLGSTLQAEVDCNTCKVNPQLQVIKEDAGFGLDRSTSNTDGEREETNQPCAHTSRWSHLLPKINKLRRKIQEQEETGERKFVVLGNHENIQIGKATQGEQGRTTPQLRVRREAVEEEPRNGSATQDKVLQNNPMQICQIRREKVFVTTEPKHPNPTGPVPEPKPSNDKQNCKAKQKTLSLPSIREEPVQISHVAVAKSKAANLMKKRKTGHKNIDYLSTASGKNKSSLNDLSHITDEKIMGLTIQLESEKPEFPKFQSSSGSHQVPSKASPRKQRTLLGGVHFQSRQQLFRQNTKTDFGQKRENVIAEQMIKDPLLQMLCQRPVCLPPVGEGFLFQPVLKNLPKDVLFPKRSSGTQDDWVKLAHCLYLRIKPAKNT